MDYYQLQYDSRIGKIYLLANEHALVGLWIEGQQYAFQKYQMEHIEVKNNHPVLIQTVKWLDDYFLGKKPSVKELKLEPSGTLFQQRVWELLCRIPYGETTTYGAIAQRLIECYGYSKMSAQAVGSAVGHNPISIIIPCHRVIGSNGSLVGYAGGLDIKRMLLKLEGVSVNK